MGPKNPQNTKVIAFDFQKLKAMIGVKNPQNTKEIAFHF